MKKDKLNKEEMNEKENCNCGDNCNCGEECNCNDECCNEHECCCEECSCCEEEIANDAKLQIIIQELQNKLLYKDAELINYRRRKDEEVSNMLKFANQDLIMDMLTSIDNLERAISSTKENDENKNLLVGVKMTYNELVNTLKKYGVEEINESGIPFDHNVHNAVMTDCRDDLENDVVIEILVKGYKLKERVIRPAMVKVNNK